jgi:hypothetical protein
MWKFSKAGRIQLVIALLFISGCSRGNPLCERDELLDDERKTYLASGATWVSREETEVYAAYLRSRKSSSAQFPIVVVNTLGMERVGAIVTQTHLFSLKDNTLEAFGEMGQVLGVLDDSLRDTWGVCLISDATLGLALNALDGNYSFLAAIRSVGYMRLTRVGISPDRQQAMFFMIFLRGGKSGYSALILMGLRYLPWV